MKKIFSFLIKENEKGQYCNTVNQQHLDAFEMVNRILFRHDLINIKFSVDFGIRLEDIEDHYCFEAGLISLQIPSCKNIERLFGIIEDSFNPNGFLDYSCDHLGVSSEDFCRLVGRDIWNGWREMEDKPKERFPNNIKVFRKKERYNLIVVD
jgi:hypothetical protein